MSIQILSEHLINQIKAGEVVERPSMVLKEIIENSLDAGSTKIEIQIENNGLNLISVVDNGSGISFHELPLAFARHATSKLAKFEDLYSLYSYGFRGEALASIASISRLQCQSSPTNNDGGKIIIEGGKIISHTQVGNKTKGTSLFIQDLFFNTPARLNFIRSQQAEKSSIKYILNSFILSNPKVEFQIRWDQADKEIYPACDEKNLEDRVQKLFFKNKKNYESLIKINANYDNHSISGYISEKSSHKANYKTQYLFINGRLIQDKSFHQTILRMGKEYLWSQSEIGHYCLFFDVPKELIDVNIHPNKVNVKLQKTQLFGQLLKATLERKKTHVEPHLPIPPKNESFDLKQNYSSTDHEQNDNQLKVLFKNKHYSLIQSEEKIYLLNIQEFLKNFFLNQSKKSNESSILPLIIAEPFSIDHLSNVQKNWLKSYFIEVDTLENQQNVIRSIPYYLNGFDLINFLKEFLIKKGDFNKMDFSNCQVSFNFILQALHEQTIDELIKDKTIIELNDKIFSKLFLTT